MRAGEHERVDEGEQRVVAWERESEREGERGGGVDESEARPTAVAPSDWTTTKAPRSAGSNLASVSWWCVSTAWHSHSNTTTSPVYYRHPPSTHTYMAVHSAYTYIHTYMIIRA